MGDRREKTTLIPPFDPELLARELEDVSVRPTLPPSFDPSSYARMAEEQAAWTEDVRESRRTMPAATPPPPLPGDTEPTVTATDATATMGRAMYGSYLSSDYPEALVLAERVLEREPEHALAQLVAQGCRERLGVSSEHSPRLLPSSVVRLKRGPFDLVELVERGSLESAAVLGHIDGVADVAMVAELAGVPRPEALDRLHELLELGVLEVVNE